jgi:hypothetical protein
MKTLKQIISAEPACDQDDEQLSESLVGKGFAVAQNRQHQTFKSQVLSKLNQVQSDCRRGIQEDDQQVRDKLIFEVLFDLAATLRLFAEMSARTNNVATTAVLDQESSRKDIAAILSILKARK